jgi:hypothetical protein
MILYSDENTKGGGWERKIAMAERILYVFE